MEESVFLNNIYNNLSNYNVESTPMKDTLRYNSSSIRKRQYSQYSNEDIDEIKSSRSENMPLVFEDSKRRLPKHVMRELRCDGPKKSNDEENAMEHPGCVRLNLENYKAKREAFNHYDGIVEKCGFTNYRKSKRKATSELSNRDTEPLILNNEQEDIKIEMNIQMNLDKNVRNGEGVTLNSFQVNDTRIAKTTAVEQYSYPVKKHSLEDSSWGDNTPSWTSSSKADLNLPEEILKLYGMSKSNMDSYRDDNRSIIEKYCFSVTRKNFPMSAPKLNIFRFDHTMTNTLSPNPELYSKTMNEFILSNKSPGLDWYNKLLPNIELNNSETNSEIKGGISELCCDARHASTLGEIYGKKLLSDPEKVELIKSLNYKWCLSLLCMVRNGQMDPNTSNILIIDRRVKMKTELFDDLRILSKLGFYFHYEIYVPVDTSPTNKFSKIVLTLLDEIYNARHAWASRVNKVTIFQPMDDYINRDSLLAHKGQVLHTERFDFSIVYTAKRCSYLPTPSTELNFIFSAIRRIKAPIGKLTLCDHLAAFRLTYDSSLNLLRVLRVADMLPPVMDDSYKYDFTNIIVSRNKLSNTLIKELSRDGLYTGRILEYGRITDSIFAVKFLINTENTTWLYGDPILVVAMKKMPEHIPITRWLSKITWIPHEGACPIKLKFYVRYRLNIIRT